MTGYRALAAIAVLILVAPLTFGAESTPVPKEPAPDDPGYLEILDGPPARPGGWDLTHIRFAVKGPYTGRILFSQYKTIAYQMKVQHGSASRAEYQAALPSPMDQVPYKVSTDKMTREAEAVPMEYVRAHTSGPAGIFGAVTPSRGVKLKAVLIAVLYLVCISQLLRLKPAGKRALAATAATVAFSVAELLLVWGRVEESSVTLLEGKAGRGSCSYEFVGVAAPWGGRASLSRDDGVLFPVYADKTSLWSEKVEVDLVGRGSSIERLDVERGKWKTFCCISPGGLDGKMELKDGGVVNSTGLDMRGYLFRDGRLLDLGELPAGGRAGTEGASPVSKSELLNEGGNLLKPAAVALLAWRTRYLETKDTVIGLVSPSRLVFFEASGDAGAE